MMNTRDGNEDIRTSAVTVPTSLRVYLRAARERRNWSMERLAQEAGLSHKSQVSRIESGEHRNPHQETLVKIAKVLDIPENIIKQMCQFPASPMPTALRDVLNQELTPANDVAAPVADDTDMRQPPEYFSDISTKMNAVQARIREAVQLLRDENPVVRHMAAARLAEYLVLHSEYAVAMEQTAKRLIESVKGALEEASRVEDVDFAGESLTKPLALSVMLEEYYVRSLNAAVQLEIAA